MNDIELREYFNRIYNNAAQMSICIYAIMKNNDNTAYQLDIDESALSGLKTMFIKSLRNTIVDELQILNLSTADERRNAIFVYDMDIPPELTIMQQILNNDDFSLLNLSNNNLSNIKSLCIEIGNSDIQIVLYKILSPVEVFGRDKFFLVKSNTRLTKIDEEFFRFSPSFHFFQIPNALFVVKLEALEKLLGFHDVIKREALLGVQSIENLSLVENIDSLRDLIDNVTYARKLVSIARNSPVIQAQISNENIIRFCKTYPTLADNIHFNETEDKILLDTKKSKKLFMKLLMDDFLFSQLTNLHYESIAKDNIEIE